MKGILFKPWKIKAIAASSPDFEWQTRRLSGLKEINTCPDRWQSQKWGTDYKGRMVVAFFNGYNTIQITPRYQVGEVVYIKEPWEIEQIDGVMAEISYASDIYGKDNHDVYIADKKLPQYLDKIQPTLFMP